MIKKLPRWLQWLAAALVIFAAVLAQASPGFSQTPSPQAYLPLILYELTFTPTPSPTATITSTPTVTPTPTITPTPTWTPIGYMPLIMKHYPIPLYATSYYIQDNSSAAMLLLGCKLGQRDLALAGKQDSLVILNFRQMWIEEVDGVNVYGVASYNSDYVWVFTPLNGVENAVKEFITGYYNCSGTDDESQLTVGVGVSNYGRMNTGTYDQDILRATMFNFGQRFGTMSNTLNTWAVNEGYAGQVYVGGAIDIEWSSSGGWNTPYVTRGWVDGYAAKTLSTKGIYFNFGACVGCPTVPNPNWTYYYLNPWTQADIWYVSWGAAPAYPLPEIYLNSGVNALQWQAISKYGALYEGQRMDFVGPMTQYQACQVRTSDTSCVYMDNTPEEGWAQLFDAINSDPLTRQDLLRWVTDITWQIK
jgi:hypothetical protein